MGHYTEEREIEQNNFEYEDEPEKLEEVMKGFRNFDKALDNFLIEHGYVGEKENIKDKIKYIQKKFDAASVDHIDPRVLENWFSIGNRPKTEKPFALFRVEREKLFRFCFAFQLPVEESNDFFRRVCLQRGFDCHDMEEAVYYYAISNKFNYPEAKAIIAKLPKENKKKDKIDLDCNDILYTNAIIVEISRLKNADELIQFFYCNYDRFKYNNVAAYEFIKKMWNKISEVQGLADKEKFNLLSEDWNLRKESQKPRSKWDVYLQILGLAKTSELISGVDRSVSAFLKDNKLLHPLAADSFPGRQELEAILIGKPKSYEVIRKTLVILSFYRFWVNKALEYKGEQCRAKRGDYEKYIETINHYLNDVGYPMLYVGNPFDWIFMYAASQKSPLDAFRDIIYNLYEVKAAELESKVW